ncbi:SRPBCC family protein [Glycomyces buryatensis]|uniref:Transcriptional regulator n=1 Tax=Glycomyces buryatensis TaxID=2570927 RepID=A0A4S8QJE3_9ACTN|nr:SRPBCC family protein [Glycomyces buryatensis]THV43125.1 transcriptional regulator [Glycomyces buryatensis]
MESNENPTNTSFVYVIHINCTPERLWTGLTDPEFTKRYWGVEFESAWSPGTTMVWKERGIATADPAQIVLDSDPAKHLAYTWHTFTPEWAQHVGVPEEVREVIAAESRSKVAFDIEPVGRVVKLTLTHNGFEPVSTVREMISEGWPALLSSLKTLLETGEPLPEED